MKRRWIEYRERWQPSLLSYWVHIETDDKPWAQAQHFTPPLPGPVPGRGYPVFCVELDGVEFRFASLDELRACLDTLSRKLLPTTTRLARDRGGHLDPDAPGPEQHWLSRLPLQAKPWRYREKAVKYLAECLVWFGHEIAKG